MKVSVTEQVWSMPDLVCNVVIGNAVQIVTVVYSNLEELLPKTPQQYVHSHDVTIVHSPLNMIHILQYEWSIYFLENLVFKK